MCYRLVGDIDRLDIPPIPKSILKQCGWYASPDGSGIFPGLDRMAAELGWGRSTIQRNFREFCASGVLIRHGDHRGGRGRANEYEIDLDRAEEIYPEHAYAGRAKLRENRGHAPDANRAPHKTKGVPTRHVSDDQKVPADDQKVPAQDAKGARPGHPKEGKVKKEGASAPAPASTEPGGAAAAAPQEGAATAPINRHWKSKEAAIIAAIGQTAWVTFFKIAVCETDDGEQMTLSFPSPALADIARQKHGETLARILEREIEIITLTYHQRAGWLEARRHEREAVN